MAGLGEASGTIEFFRDEGIILYSRIIYIVDYGYLYEIASMQHEHILAAHQLSRARGVLQGDRS